MAALGTSGLNIPGVKTAGQGPGSPPLQRPSESPRVNRKFVVQCSLGWESRTSSWIYNERLPTIEVEFPFMCISNPMVSTQSVFTPAVGSGVPQAEGGWGAEQPGGSSQPEISPLPPTRTFQDPTPGQWTSLVQRGHPKLTSAARETHKCQVPQKPWRKRGEERWGDLVERKTQRKGG